MHAGLRAERGMFMLNTNSGSKMNRKERRTNKVQIINGQVVKSEIKVEKAPVRDQNNLAIIVNQIKNSARLKENLQKILGLDCYHKTWITISKSKDEEIKLSMLFFSKKEFACFERKIDKKYIVEKENGFGTLVTMQI